MIYLVGLIAGILNGLFTTGAGQLIVFYFVFILKKDTYISRAVSIALILVASLFSIFNYSKLVEINYGFATILIILSCLFGFIGSKIMKKVNPLKLNLFSGLVVMILSIYSLVKS